MIRRAVALIVLAVVVLLAIADRLTESATARALAVKARQASLLGTDPAVSIHGFPFLTQAVRGRFGEIDVTTHDIHRGGLRIDTVVGRFHGVHLGLVAALDGQVSGAAIDRASGELDITYADLNVLLRQRRLTISPSGSVLRVAGQYTVAGHLVPVSGPVTTTVADGTLALVPVTSMLRGPSGPLPADAAGSVATAFRIEVVLRDLPFGLRPQTLRLDPTGIRATGTATGLAVPVPADASQA